MKNVNILSNLLLKGNKKRGKENMEEKKNNWAKWDLPDGYEFQDKEGNVINTDTIKLVKKQPQYPKYYLDCAIIVNSFSGLHIDGYKNNLLKDLQDLLIRRDAYWKIAGEQMGLGKPWEPDWTTFEGMPAIFRFRYNIVCDFIKNQHCLLVFPTVEMRDAFYENFKKQIEKCKELL